MNKAIVNDQNTITINNITYLICSTGVVDGLWVYTIKDIEAGIYHKDIPYHKIKKYL